MHNAPSLTIKNGIIRTFDPGNPLAESIHINDGKIEWIGESASAPTADIEFDLKGRTVLPGLIDAHSHLYWMADDRLRLNVSSADVTNLSQLLEFLRAAANAKQENEWVVAVGVSERSLAERRMPNREELDKVSGGRPLALKRVCGHSAVANSAALHLLDINDNFTEPYGAVIERTNGRPNGILREKAADLLFKMLPGPPRDELADSLNVIAGRYLSCGVTGATEAAVGFTSGFSREWDVWNRLRNKGQYGLRMAFMLGLTASEAHAANIFPGGEDLDWQVRTLKFFADGTLGNRTAALSAHYEGAASRFGLLMQPPEELISQIVAARALGWEIAIHAIGDAAIDIVSEALDAATAVGVGGGSYRVEHLAMPTDAALERLLRSNAIIVTQHGFLKAMGDGFIETVGNRRAERLYMGRTLIDKGFIVAGSSDAPATALSPFAGIAAAVDRRTGAGIIVNAKECLTVEEAIGTYTTGAAAALGHEGKRGVLRLQSLADVIVLDRDPLQSTADEIHNCNVELTIVRGEIAYENWISR